MRGALQWSALGLPVVVRSMGLAIVPARYSDAADAVAACREHGAAILHLEPGVRVFCVCACVQCVSVIRARARVCVCVCVSSANRDRRGCRRAPTAALSGLSVRLLRLLLLWTQLSPSLETLCERVCTGILSCWLLSPRNEPLISCVHEPFTVEAVGLR